jgi:signal transduction histidine kinase
LPDFVRTFAATLDDQPAPDAAARLERELTRLVRLRRAQGHTANAVLLELGSLEEVILDAVLEQAVRVDRVDAAALLSVVKRFHRTTRDLAATTRRLYQRDLVARRHSRAAVLGSFSRVITHELRNRANAARLSFAVLRASPEDERAEPLAALDQSLTLLEHTIADISSVTSVQARELPTEGRLQPIAELLDQLRAFEQLVLADRIEVRLAGPFPDLAVDADKLQLVVFHLIANALKHADRRKEERWVEIRATAGATRGECRFEVEDNGLGLPGVATLLPSRSAGPAEAAPPSESEGAHADPRQAPPRAEIGIVLALEAVRQLGGRLWIEANAPDRGTTVAFTMRSASLG